MELCLPRVPRAMSANFWNDSRNADVQAAVVLQKMVTDMKCVNTESQVED